MPRKTPVRLICERCQSPFETLDYRPCRPARFCSRACGQPNQDARIELACRQCGISFHRKAYMQDWSRERGPFCGFQCYGDWQKTNSVGPENPNWTERSPVRGASQWERNRLAVLGRDGYRCVRCTSQDRLHVHHKTHWAPGQDDPHATDNLETLCASCHRREHPMPHGPDGRFLPNHH